MTLPTEDVAALVARLKHPFRADLAALCDDAATALSTLAGERYEALATPLQARLDAVEGQEPVYKAIERILDEHSAWISRPNHEVTKAIALAATIAAHEIVKGMAASDAVELQGQDGEAAALREFIRTVNRPDDAAMLSEVAAKLYEFQRFKEAKANSPDWEQLWAEQAERAETAEAALAAMGAVAQRKEHSEPDEGRKDAGSTPASIPPASMTERLIDAAIYNEQAEGVYRTGAMKELNDARAAIEAALASAETQEKVDG